MIIVVHRTGGFAGLTEQAELDTADQPDQDRLETVAGSLDQARLGTGRPQPDRYVYRIEVRDERTTQVTVAEQDLDPATAWLLDRVLASG